MAEPRCPRAGVVARARGQPPPLPVGQGGPWSDSALLSFNLGVELGQLAVLAAATVAGLLRWVILMLVCAAAVWALSACAARLPAVVPDAPTGEGAVGVGPGG